VTPILGGITNQLRLIHPAGSSSAPAALCPEPVLLRVFGAGTDAFLDRAAETAALLELNASGLGATCLGVFANGRLERFMRRRRPLAPAETAEPATERLIAAELARFHASKVVAAGWDAEHDRAPAPQTWDVLRGWLERIREAGDDDENARPDAKTSAAATRKTLRRRLRLDDLREDVDELERRSVESGAPCVYLHNDLLGGNILVAEDDAAPAAPGDDDSRPRARDDEDGREDDSVRSTTRGDDPNVSSASKSPSSVAFIDFEYACYGPRGFDVANHLIERAGFECDWSRLPDAAARLRFSRAYVDASTAASTPPVDDDAKKAAAARLAAEAEAHYPASHLWWGVWAALQAATLEGEFDYAAYAERRIDAYRERRMDPSRYPAKTEKQDARLEAD
jgi:ethanolamine kinase